jgi:hypothetical protein
MIDGIAGFLVREECGVLRILPFGFMSQGSELCQRSQIRWHSSAPCI